MSAIHVEPVVKRQDSIEELTMSLAISTTLHTTFDNAVELTRKALADQGFGVLTEIDMKATLKAKLGRDVEDYTILGACNPPLAHRAIDVDRQIGLLLPCNVVVRADPTVDDTIIVDAMDPEVMVQVSDQPDLRAVADDAAASLRRAIESLSQTDTVG
ncbi:ABC transporter, ATP-binding protein [Mycolicibacterium fortuitum subsp. acetamidolyticum]|uniref:ABC transporter, ATP-binding protein n=2 Tax=Mycobacteriaceae TaxID=1762 RepID=A0A100WL34_MYCFO|nr:ABC transporter, ATP-binding protein [Mycolicibacterium fortuitum subsp. acetamidolyticum]